MQIKRRMREGVPRRAEAGHEYEAPGRHPKHLLHRGAWAHTRAMSSPFFGTYTALVTPFKDEPRKPIDWPAFERLVEMQITGGVQGLVPCGTTGESPTLSTDEQHEVIRRTVKLAESRVRVVAGTGTNSTEETIERSQTAERAGVHAVMVVVPYYNKPTQEGLCEHYVSVAHSVGCPVIVYNIPGRTGIDLTTDTLARICEAAPNVLAIKEATGNVLRAQEIVRVLGSRITVLCGDDALTLPMMATGAEGVISVTSNVLPGDVARVTTLAREGRWADAQRAHHALVPVHEAMFIESNPAPVKAALASRGICQVAVRGPLRAATENTRAKVSQVLESYRAP